MNLQELVDGLTEEQSKEILKKIGVEQPGVVLTIMEYYKPDDEPPPGDEPPAPPEGNRRAPEWCSCNNCRIMQTAAEDICCRQQPENCLANTPVSTFLVVVVDCTSSVKSQSLVKSHHKLHSKRDFQLPLFHIEKYAL